MTKKFFWIIIIIFIIGICFYACGEEDQTSDDNGETNNGKVEDEEQDNTQENDTSEDDISEEDLIRIPNVSEEDTILEARYGGYTVKVITYDIKQKIESQPDYQDNKFVLAEDITDEQFTTIANLPWIKFLDITNCKNLTTIEPVSNLKNLQELTMIRTKIKDISPLAKIDTLTKLDAGSLDIEDKLDISPLKDLKNLKEVRFYGTKVEKYNNALEGKDMTDINLYMSDVNNIEFVKGMDNLTSLDVYACSEITDISPLEGLPIEYLNLYMCDQINDWMPINTLKELKEIWLHFTDVKDLSFLTGLENLEDLSLDWNETITDISPLTGLSNIKDLGLDDAQITDITVIGEMSTLENLDLSGTLVKDISPLSNLKNLTRLYLSETNVEDITPLSTVENLEYLYLNKTSVSDLSPIGNLKELYTLEIEDTQISDISILKGLTKLTYLSINGTQVSDLSPLTESESLYRLEILNTPVTDLTPLQSISTLKTLNISGNITQNQIDQIKSNLPELDVRITD